MKVVNQWMVVYYGRTQMLVEKENGEFYVTCNGAFNQREMSWMLITKEEADSLINK